MIARKISGDREGAHAGGARSLGAHPPLHSPFLSLLNQPQGSCIFNQEKNGLRSSILSTQQETDLRPYSSKVPWHGTSPQYANYVKKHRKRTDFARIDNRERDNRDRPFCQRLPKRSRSIPETISNTDCTLLYCYYGTRQQLRNLLFSPGLGNYFPSCLGISICPHPVS